jgi:hypothetical protein
MDEMILFAKLCKIASKLPGETASIPKDVGGDPPIYYDGTKYSCQHNIHAYMWICDMKIYLAFHSSRDLRSDLVPVSSRRGQSLNQNVRVHMGYQEQFLSLEHHLFRDLQKQEQTKGFLDLNIMGHGFSGAVATLAASHFSKVYSKINRSIRVNCYTFGAPRVGNKKFTDDFKVYVRESMRFEIPGDRLAKTPTIGYLHVGKKILLQNGNMTKKQRDSILPVRLISMTRMPPIQPSHSIDDYLNILSQ